MHQIIEYAVFAICVGCVFVTSCAPKNSYLTREQAEDPLVCAGCHPAQYNEWASSMHAYAADDPIFVAMNQRGQRETQGALGAFCVNCHAPMAVRDGATVDGLNLASVPTRLKGVSCYFCHTVDSVTGSHNDPLRLAGDVTMRGEYDKAFANQAHPSVYSALHDRSTVQSSQLCGSCHDVVAPPGAAIERTFSEWQASVFSQSPGGTSCSECHMNESVSLQPIADVPGAPLRRAHSHRWPGVDLALNANSIGIDAQANLVQNFLNSSIQAALCVLPNNAAQAASVRVILDNVAAGHGWPSGATQDRRAWVEVIARDGNNVLYSSGVVPPGGSPTQNTHDDTWLLRDCMFDAQGAPVDMFWQAASHESNTLPPLATFDAADPRYYQTHIEQTFPRDPVARFDGIPDTVMLKLRLTPVGTDVLTSLVQSGDLDPNVAARMQTFDVLTLTWTAAALSQPPSFVENGVQPAYCVSTPNFNLAAQRTTAVNHTRCAP